MYIMISEYHSQYLVLYVNCLIKQLDSDERYPLLQEISPTAS